MQNIDALLLHCRSPLTHSYRTVPGVGPSAPRGRSTVLEHLMLGAF
jgi:hypothetical protein